MENARRGKIRKSAEKGVGNNEKEWREPKNRGQTESRSKTGRKGEGKKSEEGEQKKWEADEQ